MRVLIAEDEKSTAKALKLMLEKNKFTVDIVHNGLDAWDYCQANTYDIIVLDIMMPGMSGLAVLEKIRGAGIKTPVMFLTAKGEIHDRVNGLNAGADDYLAKPFAMSEFIARVKALARRNEAYADSKLQLGNLSLDCNRYMLVTEKGSASLTNKEFQLIELFMRHPTFIFPTEHLMDKIWGPDSDSNIDVVPKHISLLRKKLNQIDASVEIRTVRGAGYCLEVKRC